MKKRIFLTLLAVSMLVFIFAVSVSAVELIKSSSDEFGEVNVVDGLTSASSDKTAKVVLENADGTYSTFYTYYIYPTFNWRKDMTTVDFEKLNDALGTSYTYGSVIRLEALYDFEYHELKADMYQSLKEIHFPENSKITEIRRWYSNVGVLEKINIPASVTKLQQNAFRDCTGLKEVTFDKGSSLETITAEAFKGCTSLEEISLPDSVTSVGASAFWGCTSLRTIRYGANLETFASRATSHTTVFYISKTTMKDFTGKMDNNYFGDSYTPKAATIFFTGNYDEALAFRAKATHKDAYNGTGGLSNAEIVEWNSQNPDSYYISEASWTIVYGYNQCLAFYGGEHLEGEITYAFEGEKYLSAFSEFKTCTRCQSSTKEKVCDPLFECNGFSTQENGDGGIVVGFRVDTVALKAYEEIKNVKIDFGVFAVLSDNLNGGDIFDENGEAVSGVINASLKSYEFACFELKVIGFKTEAHKSARLVLGAYVATVDEDTTEYTYIQDTSYGEPLGKYYTVSYYDIIPA